MSPYGEMGIQRFAGCLSALTNLLGQRGPLASYPLFEMIALFFLHQRQRDNSPLAGSSAHEPFGGFRSIRLFD